MINIIMDYFKHYALLIERAKNRQLLDYAERHHITPKCIGGDDKDYNLVYLTPEEHYLAHQLLVKMYPKERKLIYAANMMTVNSHGMKRNNKIYGWLKRRYITECKNRKGKNNPSYGKFWYYDPVTLKNGKYDINEIPEGWIKGRVPPKETNCISCGEKTGSLNAKWCDEHRPKMKQKVFRNKRTKVSYTREDKIIALRKCNGNIRQALYYLGLGDGGTHYKKMRELLEFV